MSVLHITPFVCSFSSLPSPQECPNCLFAVAVLEKMRATRKIGVCPLEEEGWEWEQEEEDWEWEQEEEKD